MLNCFKYFHILFIKGSGIFWPRDVIDTRVLAHYDFQTHKDFSVVSSAYVLNCFKYFQTYFLGHLSQKNQTRKKLNYVKMTRYLQIFLNYIKFQND